MTIDLASLATDVPFLHQMVRDFAAVLQERDARIHELEHQLAVLRRSHFGRRSERLDPNQLLLFGEVAEAPAPPRPPAPAPRPKPKKGHGRRPLPEHLPRERVEHDVPPAERSCAKCGAELVKIGEEVSRQLDYVPASFVVIEHARIKYACKHCEETVVLAPLPPQAIEKGLPGPGLLAHVLVSKYDDHLPLYRQSETYARQGVDLDRSTLCGWVRDAAWQLTPLVRAMTNEVLASKVIHTDDTPVPVQDRLRRGSSRTGRLWVYRGDAAHPSTVFHYTPDRKRDGPAGFLGGYQGYLRADAFSGYDAIYAGEAVIEVACWAHARRKFFDAQTTDSARATAALAVGFDPFLGFYHQLRYGRPALALDIMEEFRPIIADSVVLAVVNNAIIAPGDFLRRGPAVALKPIARKKFIQAYERRLDSLVTHPVFGYRISYRRVLEVQFRLLARLLAGEIPAYPPFRTR